MRTVPLCGDCITDFLYTYLGQGDRKSGTVFVFYSFFLISDCPNHVFDSVLTFTWAVQPSCCSKLHMNGSSSSSFPNVALYFWLWYLSSSECLTREYGW
jgi:hypothetical protein